MAKYHVTLEINTEEGNPGKWDWVELIGQDVTDVLNVKEISA